MKPRHRVPMCLLTLLFLLIITPASAKKSFLKDFKAAYPASKLAEKAPDGISCALCHPAKDGGGFRTGKYTPYGNDYRKNKRKFAAIEKLDSDKDGIPNLQEILAGTDPSVGTTTTLTAVTPTTSSLSAN